MPRSQPKYPHLRKEIGGRLIAVIEQHLGMSLAAAAKSLEYKNATTLQAVKRGKSLPDPEKLVRAANLWRDSRGRKLDLHWLLTGEGNPFPSFTEGKSDRGNDFIKLFEQLTDDKRHAVLTLIQPDSVRENGKSFHEPTDE